MKMKTKDTHLAANCWRKPEQFQAYDDGTCGQSKSKGRNYAVKKGSNAAQKCMRVPNTKTVAVLCPDNAMMAQVKRRQCLT